MRARELLEKDGSLQTTRYLYTYSNENGVGSYPYQSHAGLMAHSSTAIRYCKAGLPD